MPNQNWIQLLVVLMMILGPAFGKMLQVAKKKAEENKRRTTAQRHRELELRTGRDASGETVRAPRMPAPAGEAEPDRAVLLEEIARRRQEQIEAMRRRARGGAGAPAPARSGRPAPASTGRPAQPAPRAPKAKPASSGPKSNGPARAPARAQAPARADAGPPVVPPPVASRGTPARAPARGSTGRPTSTGAGASGGLFDASAIAARPSRASEILGPVGQRGSAWRRAIIMNEILSRPISERSPEM